MKPQHSTPAVPINVQRRRASAALAAWLGTGSSGAQLAMPLALGLTGIATPAQAQSTATATIELLRAPAWLESGGQRLPLGAGATVGAQQTVVTGDNARVLMRLPEGSLVALGANSRMTLESLSYGKSASDSVFSAALSMAVGTFRYVTAQAEKLNFKNRRVSLRTSTATIGIRGTRFWAQSNDEHEMVCLFDGKVDITRLAGSEFANEPVEVLDEPNAFWIAPKRRKAKKVAIATPVQVADFGAQLATPAGSGLVKPGGGFSIASNIWREARAQALVAQLAELGYVSRITPCASGAVNMFDVIIDNYASEADARDQAPLIGALVNRTFELVPKAK